MKDPYEDIIHMPHHVSASRPRMSMLDRAAQFSPFAALTGYDAAIRETGRLTDRPVELDVDAIAMLNEKIQILAQRSQERPEVTVTYFEPDERKSGGAYVQMMGRVKKVDPNKRSIIMEDGARIGFDRIYSIGGALFREEVY